MALTYDVDKYRAAAWKAFGAFTRQMARTTPPAGEGRLAYWRLGCAFDTMTDYLLLLKESSNEEDQALYGKYKLFWANEIEKGDWSLRTDPYAMYLRAMVYYNTACCYDDYCWWGIASSKALPGSPYHSLFADLFPDPEGPAQPGGGGITDFQNAAKAIWALVNDGDYEPVMMSVPTTVPGYDDCPWRNGLTFAKDYGSRPTCHGGSPNAWARVQADTPKGLASAYCGSEASQVNVEPRYPGGMWQYDYYWNQKEESSEFRRLFPYESCGQYGNPNAYNENPNWYPICPFQVTLMSGLMLVYASRLHAWLGEDEEVLPLKATALEVATDVELFLSNWFSGAPAKNAVPPGQLPPDERLLRQFDGKAVARERVPIYKDHSAVTAFSPDRVWCGDQGLVLGGLVDYHQATATVDGPGYIKQILRGTLDKLDYPPYGIQPFFPSVPGKDAAAKGFPDYPYFFSDHDYWSGAGVFWRYLFQTFGADRDSGNADVRDAVLTTLKQEDNPIFRSAETAATKPRQPWSDKAWADDDTPLFKWFNVLATLTAAIRVMEAHNSQQPS